MANVGPTVWYSSAATGISVFDLGTVGNTSGATLATAALNVPAGSLVAVHVNEAVATTAGTLSDGTNSYSLATSQVTGGSAGIGQIFYFYYSGAQTGITLTYTKAGTGHVTQMASLYASGIASSSPLDTSVTATSQATTTTTPTVTSGTPTVVGELVLGALSFSASSTLTPSSPGGFGPPFDASTSIISEYSACIGGGSLNVAGLSPVTYAPVLSNPPIASALMIVGFKPAASGTGWFAVPTWQASHSYAPGALIRQASLPAIGSERVYANVTASTSNSTSSGTEPTWTVTKGALQSIDGAVYWQEVTGQPGVNGDLTNTPTWAQQHASSTTITIGLIIQDSSSGSAALWIARAGVTIGSTLPAGFSTATAGTSVTDNAVTWISLGLASSFGTWAAPHARQKNAATATWGAAGHTFYTSDNHAETQAAANTVAFPGTNAAPNLIYCVDHTAALPPTGSNLKTTATITTTGANELVVSGSIDMNGFVLQSGSGAVVTSLALGTFANLWQKYENCTFQKLGTSAAVAAIQISGLNTELVNTTVQFGNVGDQFEIAAEGNFKWSNTPNAIQGAIIPTYLFSGNNGIAEVFGVDFSALTTDLFYINFNLLSATFENCKLPSGIVDATTILVRLNDLVLINCDSAGTTYQQVKFAYAGTLTPSTALYRGGAAQPYNGVTSFGWSIAASANALWQGPFEAFPLAIWNTTLSTNRGVTVYGLWAGASLPNNDQIWIDVEYLGSASSPMASFATGSKANGLATGSAQTADSTSDWTGGAASYQTAHAYGAGAGVFIKAGNASPQQVWFVASHSGTGTSGSSTTIFNGQSDGAQVVDNSGGNQITWQAMTRFSMAVSLSTPQPALVGDIIVKVKVATPSTVFYVDPLVTLS